MDGWELPWRSAAEESGNSLTVLLGCFDNGYVTAAGQHDELGPGDGAGDRLGLGGAADKVKLASHDEGRTGDAAQQRAQVNALVQACGCRKSCHPRLSWDSCSGAGHGEQQRSQVRERHDQLS